VIGRVNGAAMGGGVGLVCCCDMAFAQSSAKFGFTEVKLGLVPAVISAFVLPKIGQAQASRYFLTGERFTAAEAARIGIIQSHHATEQDLDSTIEGICKELISSGPQAVQTCKNWIQNVSVMDPNQESTKLYLAGVIARARVGVEGQSGLASFLNKSKPSWLPRNEEKI